MSSAIFAGWDVTAAISFQFVYKAIVFEFTNKSSGRERKV